MVSSLLRSVRPASCIAALASGAVLSFGLYNVHSLAGVTEGGILGLTLLLEHWFDLSPALTNIVASALCYLWGWRLLGRAFMVYSAIAAASFSLFYEFFACFAPLWPQLSEKPLTAAVLGAIFVGFGAGICVRAGGAAGGDDALAMCVSSCLHMDIQWVYMLFDLLVLGLSLSYIPVERIAYSLLTVTISGQLVGLIQRAEPRRILLQRKAAKRI